MGRKRIDLEAEMVYSQQGDRVFRESRAARLDRLRLQVSDGNYRVDTRQIAETILSKAGQEVERKARCTRRA